MKDISHDLCDAALRRFEATKAEAQVNLRVYLNNAVGVGEHPNIVQEVVDLTKTIAEASECIAVLESIMEGK